MRLTTIEEELRKLVSAKRAQKYERTNRKRIVVIFTPRSGSTWLSDLMAKTEVLGYADEVFYPPLFGITTKTVKARTELDYVNGAEAAWASGNNIFSVKVSMGDILRFSTMSFFQHFAGASFIHLRRSDLIAQAVSLFLAVESGTFHARTDAVQTKFDPKTIDRTKMINGIKLWACHILNYECLAEIEFLRYNIRPLRLIYEDIVWDPRGTIQMICKYSAVKDAPNFSREPSFQRIGDEFNDEVVSTFRKQELEFIGKLEALRPPIG